MRDSISNHLQQTWGEMVVNFSNEVVSRPSVLTVAGGDVETMNKVAEEGALVSSNQSVMTVNLHHFMIMGDGKYEDLPVKFLCSGHGLMKLKDCIDRCAGAASVLPICKVESVFSALGGSKHKSAKTK